MNIRKKKNGSIEVRVMINGINYSGCVKTKKEAIEKFNCFSG